MSKKNGKAKIHVIHRDNVINFPKPPPPGDESRKKDVESGSRYTVHFEPHWDGWTDDPEDSSA